MSATLCIGHRGARGHLPENTLPSFERAISMGCDMIELDVYNIDGELVVIHDKSVDRTTNGTGLLSSLEFADIRRLDAGNGSLVPTLAEVINLVDHRCGINIELKGDGTAGPVCALLNRYCAAGWSHRDFLLSSFNHGELAESDPAYPRGALFAKLLKDKWQIASDLGAWSVNFDRKLITQSLVEDAHARGYKVLVYTVNTPGDISKMLHLGVDGIFSDFPDRVIKARSR